jgi:predicted house-cleaning NTP pyrophosphatase (Maf/HAM1 superfamily)
MHMQVVEHGGDILEKPDDADMARSMLSRQGTEHPASSRQHILKAAEADSLMLFTSAQNIDSLGVCTRQYGPRTLAAG